MKRIISKFSLFLPFFGVLFLLCTQTSFATIVTSIKPIGLIAAAIGDQVEDVKVIVPDGASPHQYALKPSDVLAMNNSNLIVWVGPELEGFMTALIQKTQHKPIIEIAALDQVKPLLRKAKGHDHDSQETDHNHAEHDHEAGHHHGAYDMHLWLSPEIATQTAQAIYAALLKAHPEKQQILSNNLAQFQIDLRQTTKTVANQLNKVQNNGYFVFHPAYGYFESDFQLKNLGSITLNPSVQPGVKTVLDIQQKLKSEQAFCLFSEPQFDNRILNKIVENSDVKIGTLDPLGIAVPFNKTGYFQLLLNLSTQFEQCLQ